jgi:uncharacterized small protein (DUF1192 family)
MTLHNAVETIKKIGIGAGIGTGILLVFFVIFKLGAFIISVATPPQIDPPNHAFDILPAIRFPENVTENIYTYTLNTISGELPSDFPDRIHVYEITPPTPSLLNLNEAKEKARTLGFTGEQGKVLPELSLGDGKYQWTETVDNKRKLIIDTVTFNFSVQSDYLESLTTHGAKNLSDEVNAVLTVQELLQRIDLLPEDLDLEKSQMQNKDSNYNTFPKLYDIRNGSLVPTSSLSTAKVIRVDLHQKDIEYELDTGRKNVPKTKMKMPIRYPNPPFSTMNFWVTSGKNRAEVGAADFVHYGITFPSDSPATYPIKTADTAFEDLKNGNAYIASYDGLDQEVLISDIYLAYYMSKDNPTYLMPIIVFEGQSGFFAYVSAITDEWID